MAIVAAVLLFYLVILLLVALAALRPTRSPIFLSPTAMGVCVEETEFASDGNTLRGWWIPAESPKCVAVLAHGYVMNRSENAALAVALRNLGIASLAFDMRASGKSGGKTVGVGWLERKDVLAACDEAERKYPGIPRVLIGSSMGGAACAFALAEKPDAAQALVLDSVYSWLPSATLGWWSFLGGMPAVFLLAPVVLVAWPLAGFNPFAVNVAQALCKISKPILIMHGLKDNLAAPLHADKNYKLASSRGNNGVRMVWFENAGHSEARWTQTAEFLRQLESFLKDAGLLK